MDRVTRKANLKKLQLPGTAAEGGARQQRTTRKNTKTTSTETPATTISNYFLTPGKQHESPINDNTDKPETKDDDDDKGPNKLPAKPSRLKRTKLDTFVFKDPQNIPKNPKNLNKPPLNNDEDDLVVPEKKVKKAPKLPAATGRQTKRGTAKQTKKQQSIKSAFLRNEQIFAEIAAQHCAADQFNGDDIQLALAISRSEAESQGIQNDADHDVGNVVDLVDCKKDSDILIEKLKKYGFRTAEKKDYNTFAAAFLPKTNGRRPKSKWASKFTALTLRNPETQYQKLQDNIKTLLNAQLRFNQLVNDEQLPNSYNLQSSLLKNCDMENKETIIEREENTNRTNQQYFVIELFETNELAAGHLLKDWSAIQGRDTTPTTTKSQQSRERSIKLETIYRELEAFYSCRTEFDLTITNETNEEVGELQEPMQITEQTNINIVITEKLTTSNDNSIEEDTNDLDEMVALIEELNDNECSVTNSSLEKLKDILPPVTSLDMMNVSVNLKPVEEENDTFDQHNHNASIKTNSSENVKCISLDTMQLVSNCSNRTETTPHNSLQNTRSNSPDLFADSDIEMEETDSKVVNVVDLDKSDNCLEDLNVVTTYEIYSSDEVKNTSSSEHNDKPTRNESPSHDQSLYVNAVIDLTQTDLEIPEPRLSKSKAIVELDLFDDSPLEDLKQSECLAATKENIQFTLSLQSTDNDEPEQSNAKITKPMDDTIELMPDTDHDDEDLIIIGHTQQSEYLEATKADIQFTLTDNEPDAKITKPIDDTIELTPDTDHDDEEFILREIAMDHTNTSFLNFEGTKQLQTSFHKETAVGVAKDVFKDSLSVDDTLFRELCSQHLEDVSEHQTSSKNKTEKNLRISFTQPHKLEHRTDTSRDLNLTMENVRASRKNNSFTTPKKCKNSRNVILSKSLSFNDKSNISIDLTQHDDDDEDEDEGIPEGDDDDCLILSDDEINYSIWQANKTGNLKTADVSDNEQDAISIPDNQSNNQEDDKDLSQEDVISFPNKHHDEFDYMDLSTSLKSKEKSCSELERPLENSKSADFNFDRSEFGILEAESDPFDYTPTLCTPIKQINDISFLNSPTEKTAPMKRYSSCQKSSQKFNDLLRNLEKQSPSHNDFQDFDEFDQLVFESDLQATNSFKEPEGLEQLLTAEISFNKSQNKSPLPKTPTKTTSESSSVIEEEFTYKHKKYTIRQTTSPKPDYTKFSESELLKQLYNFGIKPLKRKQAVKILEYIYNQTHPLLIEDDNDGMQQQQQDIDIEMADEPSTSKLCLESFRRTCSLATEQTSNSRTNHTAKKTLQTSKSLSVTENKEKTIPSLVSSQTMAKETIQDVNNKIQLKDTCGMEMLRYSIDLKAELHDENYILQTNVTKKTPQPLLPFHIAWYNLVCSNPELHETILMYEPLELQQIYLFLKGLGYRYDPKDLKIFFDRRCIIFRYDLAAAGGSGKTTGKNRHVRKKFKTKKNK